MPKDFPVKYTDVFNRIQGKELFLTHRYNLGLSVNSMKRTKKVMPKKYSFRSQVSFIPFSMKT